MNETFNYLKKELTKQKTDLMFKPEELDKLNDNERKEIESLIVSQLKRGNRTSFSYIPSLKTVDITTILKEDIINTFDDYSKAEVYMYLFKVSRRAFYLTSIINIASNNIQVYSLLIKMYLEEPDGTKIKGELLESLGYIKDKNEGIFKEMFDKRLGNIKIDEDEYYNDPMLKLKTKFESEEQKDKLMKNLLAYRNKLLKKVEEEKKNSGMKI